MVHVIPNFEPTKIPLFINEFWVQNFFETWEYYPIGIL